MATAFATPVIRSALQRRRILQEFDHRDHPSSSTRDTALHPAATRLPSRRHRTFVAFNGHDHVTLTRLGNAAGRTSARTVLPHPPKPLLWPAWSEDLPHGA